MKKVIEGILRNPVCYECIALFIYAFYSVVFAVAALPAALLVRWGVRLLGGGVFQVFAFAALCFFALYIFWICATFVVGLTERLLTLGFKPGVYPPGSPTFLRWLINSGLHVWALHLVLPFVVGTNWSKIFLRCCGAKIGKDTFLNTKGFHDPYLLEIQDSVVVGGDVNVTCHLFDNGHLVLGRIVLGEGTMIGAGAYLTPGCRTGKNSRIGMYTHLRRNTVVKDGETIMSSPGMSMRKVVQQMKG